MVDLHTENAKRMFSTDKPTVDQRQQAKRAAFRALYQGSRQVKSAPHKENFTMTMLIALIWALGILGMMNPLSFAPYLWDISDKEMAGALVFLILVRWLVRKRSKGET